MDRQVDRWIHGQIDQCGQMDWIGLDWIRVDYLDWVELDWITQIGLYKLVQIDSLD